MLKKIIIALGGLFAGLLVGYFVLRLTPVLPGSKKALPFIPQNKVIGFLPYFQLSKAKPDNSKYINTLTYFGLTVDGDGKILKLSNEQETEPGWLALKSGKVDPFLNEAGKNNVDLSLLIFGGGDEAINSLMDNPLTNAQSLIAEVEPVMKQYGFTDLNLDIEKTDEATAGARANFTKFAGEVKRQLAEKNLGTLTIDVTGDSFIKNRLTNPIELAGIADHIVIMAYDFHYMGSLVTGPVAPIGGAVTTSEFDIKTAVEHALKIIPAKKIVLGVPLYGYEWETIGNFPRAAVIPGSGLTASNARVEELLTKCSTCSARTDSEASEHFLIFKDDLTGTFHQIFFPDKEEMKTKIDFAKANKLGGVALWALGFEGQDILKALSGYK